MCSCITVFVAPHAPTLHTHNVYSHRIQSKKGVQMMTRYYWQLVNMNKLSQSKKHVMEHNELYKRQAI